MWFTRGNITRGCSKFTCESHIFIVSLFLGQSSVNITIEILPDTTPELDESFTIQLHNVSESNQKLQSGSVSEFIELWCIKLIMFYHEKTCLCISIIFSFDVDCDYVFNVLLSSLSVWINPDHCKERQRGRSVSVCWHWQKHSVCKSWKKTVIISFRKLPPF